MRIIVGLCLVASSVVLHGCLVRGNTGNDESKPHFTVGADQHGSKDKQFGEHFAKCTEFIRSDEFKNNGCINVVLNKDSSYSNPKKATKMRKKVAKFFKGTGISCEKTPEQNRPSGVEGIGFRLVLPQLVDQHHPDYRHIDVWCSKNVANVDVNIWHEKLFGLSWLNVGVTSYPKAAGKPIIRHLFEVLWPGRVGNHKQLELNEVGKIMKREMIFSAFWQ